MDTWPITLFWPSSARWRRSFVTVNPGQSLSGSSRPMVTDGGGKWICEMSVRLENVTSIKAARAFLESMDGGAAVVIVPFFPEAEAPYPEGMAPVEVTFTDGTIFTDGSLFSPDLITATLGAAALSATSVAISFTSGGPLEGGEIFGVEHPTKSWRIYVVTRVGDTTCKIRPPARENITEGTPADFGNPRVVMYLDNADDALAAITPPYRSALTLRFIEADDID